MGCTLAPPWHTGTTMMKRSLCWQQCTGCRYQLDCQKMQTILNTAKYICSPLNLVLSLHRDHLNQHQTCFYKPKMPQTSSVFNIHMLLISRQQYRTKKTYKMWNNRTISVIFFQCVKLHYYKIKMVSHVCCPTVNFYSSKQEKPATSRSGNISSIWQHSITGHATE